MTATAQDQDYTRVNEESQVLCARRDFPRAVNVLQRRSPDHRRWRHAFRRLAWTAGHSLDGARREWVGAAIGEIVSDVSQPWLRGELAVDLRAAGSHFEAPGVLPRWTARDVWRAAESEGLPMEYVVRVTALPRSLDAPLDTARAVLDFRATEAAHRAEALGFGGAIEPARSLAMDAMLAHIQAESQRDAARRWRALAARLLLGPVTTPDAKG